MDRHQIGDAAWREKFKDYGLSDHFDFIKRDWGSDHGQRAYVRCKDCGHEFLTWNVPSIFKGRIKELTCPECGMRSSGEIMLTKTALAQEITDYYNSGHSSISTARKYGLEGYQVENIVCKLGKRREHLPPNPIGLIRAGRKGNEKQAERAKARLLKAIERQGFGYINGYTDARGTVKIFCKKCGRIVEYTVAWIRKGKCTCPECVRRDIEKQKAEEKQIKQREREAERTAKNPNGFSAYQLKREKMMDEVFICSECGKEYTPRQYMTDAGIQRFSNCGYCSVKCKRKAARKKQPHNKNIRHRARKYGCEYDPSLTLEKLIARNGLRCGICGELCDPTDHSWVENFGPESPTIDHIYPMAKGGGHTWKNVQVAHALCNSIKGDRVKEMSINDAS